MSKYFYNVNPYGVKNSLSSSLKVFFLAVLFVSTFLFSTLPSNAGLSTVVSTVSPAKNAINVSPNTTIVITFSQAVNPDSINDSRCIISGSLSGKHTGSISSNVGNTVFTFTPATPFTNGEYVHVDISKKIIDATNTAIVPYVYTFTVKVNADTNSFTSKTDYTTPAGPTMTQLSDFNADGFPDIAVSSQVDSVAVLLNNGNGTFGTRTSYKAGTFPFGLATGDINNDGYTDIVTADRNSNSITVLLNNGNGTFSTGVSYTTAAAPMVVAIADLNGDGSMDVSAANENTNQISVFINNGSGTLAAKVDYTVGSTPEGIFASDVDSDGYLDLVVANLNSATVSILKNNGAGTFAAKVDYACGNRPINVSLNDIDGDGDADIAVTNQLDTCISVLKNNGNGTFAARTIYKAGIQPYYVCMNDLDGDGDIDMAVANKNSNTISFYTNDGSGTFSPKVDLPFSSSPRTLTIGDVNGDGIPEIAVTNTGFNKVSILKKPSNYTLTINAVNGSVVKSPDQASYSSGTVVSLEVTPDEKYYFTGWSGDASGETNPLMVTMDGNKTITANFDIQPVYLAKYRTAKYEDWATSVDLKGKRAAAKRKFDKNFFEFTIVADSARPLKLDFGMKVTALISRNEVEDDTVLVVNNLAKITDSLLSVMPGETLLVAGTGTKGKNLAAKYSWGKKKAVTLKADSLYEQNIKGLPMPNLVNVGEELFPKGFGQKSFYFSTGLVMGIPQGLKKANSMLLKKYADVLTTLAKKVKTGYIFDTANVRCLDTLKKKPIAKQIGATGPDKYQNKLLAEALALKLNIAASMTGKFPVGLGELLYNNMDDPTNSFNSSMVSTISSYADSMLSCLTLNSKPTATLNELYAVLRNINVAFADSPYTIDTLSFGSKTQLKGLRELFDVEYLLSNDGIAPKTFAGNSESSNETPEVFALNQNYPNPFNPTTTLSFVVGNSSLVTLKVYNTLGQEVATLLNNENVETGIHEVSFDGGNLASGVYFYRLTSQSVDEQGFEKTFTDVKRMILIK